MYTDLEEKINYIFNNRKLLEQVFVHSSYANEKKIKSNERLEFLGDAILEFVISSYLFVNYSKYPEGDLTKFRASIVCEKTLSQNAIKLNLGKYLKLSKGIKNSGHQLTSILSDAFEALIGAIYIDGGIEAGEKFIELSLYNDINLLENNFKALDHKTMLQEIIQRYSQTPLRYSIIDESGPDHKKKFKIEVSHNNRVLGIGTGNTKKKAEQLSAKNGIIFLKKQSIGDKNVD